MASEEKNLLCISYGMHVEETLNKIGESHKMSDKN